MSIGERRTFNNYNYTWYYRCGKCLDRGNLVSRVGGQLVETICPECHGNPNSLLSDPPPAPPAPPEPPRGVGHVYYHEPEPVVYRERNLDKLIESWEEYRNKS